MKHEDQLQSLLSILTDDDDICFWQMSVEDGYLHFPETARFFFHINKGSLPETVDEWIDALVVPEDRQTVTDQLSRAGKTSDYVPRFTFRIRGDDGATRWIEQRGATTGSAAQAQVIWLSQDITEKLQTADTLQVTERTLDEIVTRANVAIVTHSADGKLSYCNPGFCNLVDINSADLIGRRISSLIFPNDRKAHAVMVQRILDGEINASSDECRLLDRDGNPVWVERHVWLLPSKPGETPEFFAMFSSIEQRRQTLELLRQEHDKLQAVFENADIGLAILDDAGEIIALNTAALEILGLRDLHEARQKLGAFEQYYDFRHSDGRPMPPAAWPQNRARRGEYLSDYELILVQKESGQSRFLRYTATPVLDDAGNKILQIDSINDLTEMRRLDEALTQSRRLEALGRIAGEVAHDFNNVLTVIAGNLELIAEAAVDERQQRRIAGAIEAVEMGVNINHRLLSVARKRSLVRRRVDVARRIREMSDLLDHTIGEKVKLDVDLPDEALFAKLEPGDFDAAFLNLVANSRDAMPSGGTLSISLQRSSDRPPKDNGENRERRFLLLTVRDTGKGMSPEILRHAAVPFFTTKPPGRGVGLGLTGVYAFADQNGGWVEIDSAPGKGTEIRLYLPEIAGATVRELDADNAAMPTGSGELVLLVEGDRELRSMTIQRLTELGYDVREASNGKEATTIIETGLRPACVIFDIAADGAVDGFDFVRWLQNQHPETGLILATGYNEEDWPHQTEEEISCPILLKPYSVRELASALYKALHGPPDEHSPVKT
ncbi:PAS domain S-box protein [Martelella sp. AMO21009]